MVIMAALGGASSSKRLFVGNLYPDVAVADVEKLLSKFGSVGEVEIKSKKDIDGQVLTTFAFVNVVMSEDNVHQCIKQLHGLRWKKHDIRVQVAQESFMQKLQRERREKMGNFNTEPDPSYNPLQLIMQQKQQSHEGGQSAKVDENKSEKKKKRKKEESTTSDKDDSFAQEDSETFDGKKVGGLVCFDDQEEEDQKLRKRVYHSSSDDDGDVKTKEKVPLVPKIKQKKLKLEHEVKVTAPVVVKKPAPKPPGQPLAAARKRYYSSSSEDERDEVSSEASMKKRGNFLSKLETFNSGFWRDSGDEEEDKPREPREDPNQKRLQSLKQRQKEQAGQKQAVKSALSNVDRTGRNKITFESNVEQHQHRGSAERGGKKLFEEDESDDDNQYSDFQIRPQFEGKSGEKLLALQSKLAASDSRFRIDGRFKEEEEDDDEAPVNSSAADDENDLRAEKEMNMKVLQSIVGTTEKREKRKVLFRDTDRFDPLEASHAKFEVGDAVSSEEEDEKPRVEVRKETPMPEVGEDKSYWLQKEAFTKKGGDKSPAAATATAFSFGFGGDTGFSLLKKFGREDEYEAEELSGRKKQLDFLDRNPFKYDSSSEDEEDEPAAAVVKKDSAGDFGRELAQKSVAATRSAAAAAESFFFAAEGDKRFTEVNEFLNRAETLDELREKYETQRPVLAGIMKKKLRSKAKKQEKMAFGMKTKKKGHFKGKPGRGRSNKR